MSTLSVSDAARMAGVSRAHLAEQIARGELATTANGIELKALIDLYPALKPLAGLKLKQVKSRDNSRSVSSEPEASVSEMHTMALLIRELEWHKSLLEQTNDMMSKQMAEQRALIADQARRLDEKDRFWARQIEIAQSLLPAPKPRKKFLGLF